MFSFEQISWLELVSKKGLGVMTLLELFSRCQSASKILSLSKDELLSIGASLQVIQILKTKTSLDLVSLERLCKKENIHLVTFSDDTYPILLREISDPPLVLFYKGQWDQKNSLRLAVVGSRQCSRYALDALVTLFAPLRGKNFTIVSGAAFGVDTIAHEEALQNKIKTIAVLGCGVSEASWYPTSNRNLLKNIINEGGVVVSEYFPYQKAHTSFFPVRNRIIAGLSHAVFIVEAKEKSGALITAQLALEYGRDVAALPGTIFSLTSRGTNRLLREGARMIVSGEDLLLLLGLDLEEQKPSLNDIFSKEEEKVLQILKENGTIDDISERTHFTIGKIHSILTMLELQGAVKKINENEFYIL